MSKDYFTQIRKGPKKSLTVRINDEERRMIEEIKRKKKVNATDVIIVALRALYDTVKNEKY